MFKLARMRLFQFVVLAIICVPPSFGESQLWLGVYKSPVPAGTRGWRNDVQTIPNRDVHVCRSERKIKYYGGDRGSGLGGYDTENCADFVDDGMFRITTHEELEEAKADLNAKANDMLSRLSSLEEANKRLTSSYNDLNQAKDELAKKYTVLEGMYNALGGKYNDLRREFSLHMENHPH